MHPPALGGLDELRAVGITVSTEAGELAARTRDCWPALTMRERAGEQLVQPAAVVWPATTEQVADVYRWATRRRVPVVPYGGGAGVTGGAAPVAGGIILDTKRLRAILGLDEVSGIVTVQPGVIGQTLEEWLAARSRTLGHFPSSITVSSVGGFAAARSAGQASTRYGPFAMMVCGLEAVLPDGTILRRAPQPASAAGPDLAGLLLGAEGTLGVITELSLRVHPAPEAMVFRGFMVPSFGAGLAALRTVLQRGLRPAVVRLYDEHETQLSHAEVAPGCLLVTVCEGWPPLAALEAAALADVVAAAGGDDLGEDPARHWHAHRYDVSYRLADLLKPSGLLGDAGAVDTLEIAAPWGLLDGAYAAVRAAVAGHADLVLCHASHAYPDGACCYFSFVIGGTGDEAAARARYESAWRDAMAAALGAGATISHHHGIGLLRAPWLAAELGDGQMALLRRIKGAVDPAGIANPGKLGLGGGYAESRTHASAPPQIGSRR